MKKHIHLIEIGLLVVSMAVIVACNPHEGGADGEALTGAGCHRQLDVATAG